jgi:hypothetical protein
MNIKFAHVLTGLLLIKDKVGGIEAGRITIDASLVEDDPGSGKMVSCLTFKCSNTVQPTKYDDLTSPSTFEYTVEVFADSENRPPRYTCVETKDLTRRN